jgi:hypothetical protein
MHERAGAIGRTFQRDAETEENHQAAGVEVTLAQQLAQRAGGKPQIFLPAPSFGPLSKNLAPILVETRNFNKSRDIP